MMCPTINSYKRLLGGAVCASTCLSSFRLTSKLRQTGHLMLRLLTDMTLVAPHCALSVLLESARRQPASKCEYQAQMSDCLLRSIKAVLMFMSQMNPYFALAAIFGLGLRGIANKTALPYGPVGSPGVTRDTLIMLPTSLEAATAQFKREGSLAREVLGDYLVDHFAGTREHELELHRRAVTNWEGQSRPHLNPR